MKKILIIEDEKTLLAVLTQKLIKFGYSVFGVEDGGEAFDAAIAHRPDLILLDILLPQKDGYQILEELRNDRRVANIPVIIISNSGQPLDIQRALDLGARDYLIKAEFDPEEVVEKMEKILGPRPKVSATSQEKSPSPMPQSAMDTAKGDGATLLVVEDDRFLRNIIVQKLTAEGFIIEEAIDGAEALKKVKKVLPRLILLDLVLPEVDGFEVLERLREDPELNKIPVLVLSNLGQEEDIKRAKDLGARDYMVKAYFTPSEIVSKIQKILREVYM